MGVTEGFISNQTQITEDNDGRFTSSYFNGVVDLAYIMSRLTGRQLSQMANYRIGRIHIGLRNVNDTVDNDNTMAVGGDIHYYPPHAKTIDALQSLRTYLRKDGLETADSALWEISDKGYKGLRFGWDSDTQIISPDSGGESTAFNGNLINLEQVLNRLAIVTQNTPSGEGYDTTGRGMAMWDNRAPIYTAKIPFDASYCNPKAGGVGELPALATPFVWEASYSAQEIKAIGGLLAINLTHGNTDAAGVLEDEYEMIVSIGVMGWEEF